ncbi:MAG TPA: hypothetical protein VHQ45_10445 [Gemmatimonadaceae bacterium]|nr:hypothetical protein [Gemmatimonadaceae bacterium]
MRDKRRSATRNAAPPCSRQREAHEPGQRDLAPSFCVRLRCNGRAR